jgi:predicted  nucleic acid-binding Zn-ribbon protein
MEVKDWLYIIGIIGGAMATFFSLSTKIAVVTADLKNHKENHEKLEQKVVAHEEKINERLEKISEDIGSIKGDIKLLVSRSKTIQ